VTSVGEAHRPGPTLFRALELTTVQVQRLLTAVVGSRRATEAVLLLVDRWQTSRPGDAVTVSDWLPPDLDRESPQGRLLINALRDEFLAVVDEALQQLYRRHYRTHAAAMGGTQASRLDLLRSIDHEAAALVARYDWLWLVKWLWPEAPGEGLSHILTRLSNFAFPIKRVNFRFTYHCNISCRHCYNRSGPEARSLHLATSSMIAVVREMPAAGIDAVNLTGGEPMLYQDEVCELIRAAGAADLREVSVFTNGFWATNSEQTDRVLGDLSRAGFMSRPADHLKVSAGVYHQEFIPFERVVTLAERYHNAFGKRLTIDFEVAADRLESLDAARAAMAARGQLNHIRLMERDVQPLGRGRELAMTAAGAHPDPCGAINQIVIDPDGRVRPCCGMNNENDGVVIGRMGDFTLRQLVKRMQNDGLLHALATRPMDHLLDIGASPGDRRLFSGPCELCLHAVGAVSDKEVLWSQYFGQQRYYPFWFETRDEGRTIQAHFESGHSAVSVDTGRR